MNRNLIFLIAIFLTLVSRAQPIEKVDTLSLSDFASFKTTTQPLLKAMATKRIIGLGEGTHGTAEFYTVRYWITRILVEDFGFNYIAFENDLADTWLMNGRLKDDIPIPDLMRAHMLRIWQNEETLALLEWVKTYNRSHEHQVTIAGLDYPYLSSDVQILESLLQHSPLNDAVQKLVEAAEKQDRMWEGEAVEIETVRRGSNRGYAIADSLEKVLPTAMLSEVDMHSCRLLLMNLKQGFEPFYRLVSEKARDSIMAHNAAQLLSGRNDKMIIWAHNAHIAKKGIYSDAVGGTGAYLLRLFPNQYYALGTVTARGHHNGTTERMPTRRNVMLPVPLEEPIKGSWEAYLQEKILVNGWLEMKEFNKTGVKRPLRFVGYGMDSGKSSYDTTDLISLFDALLFIKNTHAPVLLPLDIEAP